MEGKEWSITSEEAHWHFKVSTVVDAFRMVDGLAVEVSTKVNKH